MRIAVIGAGLAGLTAAVEIRRQAPDSLVDVFEATERIGGKLHTAAFASGPTDVGAEAFLHRRTDAVEFFESLGLGDSIVHPSGLSSLVYAGGQTHSLPKGTVMGVPADSAPVAHLVSAQTASRIDAESDAAPIDWVVGGDVSVGRLVRERYGDEVVDRVVSALLGGVYACSADDLGLRATVPALAEQLDKLAEAGQPVTLSAAVRAVNSANAANTAKPTPDPGKSTVPPVFGTFRGGYAELYETLAEASGADIYLDAFVSGITPGPGGYRVVGGGEPAEKPYDKVVLATPAPTTALLLKAVAPEASTLMKSIKLADPVVVAMKFDSAEGLPENSGVLIAADEPGVHAKAFTFSSKKWPHLAERGGALIRASFGRFGDSTALRTDEDTLVDWALDDLHKITGFDGRAANPAEIYTQRWFGGLPRYSSDHLAVVDKLRSLVDGLDGLVATGAWSGGVGVPAVIADARAAVGRLGL